MQLVTRSRIYGLIGAIALLAYFVVPIQFQLNGTACSIWSFAPSGCEAGVRTVLRGAVIYCFFGGYLISLNVRRGLVSSRVAGALVYAGSIILLGAPLWLALHAAFW